MTYLQSSANADQDRRDDADIDTESDVLARAAIQPQATATEIGIRLGQTLRASREAQKLDIADCAHTLRLPLRVLKKLEDGDYTGISEGVYLRNYLMSYGTCVGLVEGDLRAVIEQLAPPARKPELVSTGNIPHAHYLWHRYTTLAAAAVLTAVIIVPLVWLGFKGGLDRELTHLEPLNSAPVTAQQVAASDGSGAHRQGMLASNPVSASRPRAEKPLMASMAPFSALDSVDKDATPPVQPSTSTVVAAPGRHTLSLTLTHASWVEVTTKQGKQLEYSLLPAGTHKVYKSAQPFHVSIGDTAGAKVTVDGKSVDLDTYQHANVAHFQVALKSGQAVIQSM